MLVMVQSGDQSTKLGHDVDVHLDYLESFFQFLSLRLPAYLSSIAFALSQSDTCVMPA